MKKKKIKIKKSRIVLKAALLHLLLEKDFTKITIQDVCKEANVGRSTFYNHYKDKFALLEATVSHYSKIAKETTYYSFIKDDNFNLRTTLARDYKIIVKHHKIIQALLSVHLPNADFEADLRKMLRQKYEILLANRQFNHAIPEELAVELYTCNALMVTKHIAHHADEANTDELADYMFQVYQSLFTMLEPVTDCPEQEPVLEAIPTEQ